MRYPVPLAVDPSALRDPGGLLRCRSVCGRWRGAVRREGWSRGAARAAATWKHVSFATVNCCMTRALISCSSNTTYALYDTVLFLYNFPAVSVVVTTVVPECLI